MPEIFIVGKNASMLTYPAELYSMKSIGVNEAAIEFKTSFAFTPHPETLEKIRNAGFSDSEIIGVKPFHKCIGQDHGNFPRFVPGLFDYITYDNRTPLPLPPREDMEAAVLRKKDHIYHNNGTSVHLLIFWCVIKGYEPVWLLGCNQNNNCLGNYRDSADPHMAVRRQFQDEMIRVFAQLGHHVICCEDYADYKRRAEYEKAGAGKA